MMPLEKAAPPLSDRELLVALLHAVVRAARPYVSSWDDLKTLLANGAALSVHEEAVRSGDSLAEAASRLRVDVTTLRRNLPPPPRRESVAARLEREVFCVIDREGRVTMAEIEALLESSAAVAEARRARPRIEVADAVVDLVDGGYLERVERDRLPTQYAVAANQKVLTQRGQSSGDWIDGIAFALTLVMDAAIKQAHEVNSEEFARRLRHATRGETELPVPSRERMPWFFVQRPSHMSPHEINERFAAAIRKVIEDLDGERGAGDTGELMHLCLALNHSLQSPRNDATDEEDSNQAESKKE